MIELTVKTLDSNNHTFNVEAESTVEQLKQKIRASLGLEIDCQRLIFCGRVLQDDQKLNECGVDNGKCLHLVQRPPPSPPSRRRTRERESERERDNVRMGDTASRTSVSPLRHHIRHLLSASANNTFVERTPVVAARMEFLEQLLTEIRGSIARLRTHTGTLDGSGETLDPQAEPMETESVPVEVPISVEGAEVDEDEEIPAFRPLSFRRRLSRNSFFRYNRPRDLGYLLEEIEVLHDEFAPYRARYIAMLRDLTSQNFPEPEREQRQRTVDMICDVMHSFAHAYHGISDISFHVGQRTPRLTSEPPSARPTLPMQAHINVVTTMGRRSMSGEGRAGSTPRRPATGTTAATAGSGSAPAAAHPPAPASAPSAAPAAATARSSSPIVVAASGGYDTSRDTFNVRRASNTDRTPIHTTTRTFAHPSTDGSTPLHYQVEIETRGHIAIPLDNSLLNGLAAVASNLHQAQAQQDLAVAAHQAAAQAVASVATQPSAPSQPLARAAARARAATQSSVRPATLPSTRAATQPSARPATLPSVRAATQPPVWPATLPLARAATLPPARATAHPLPVVQPSAEAQASAQAAAQLSASIQTGALDAAQAAARAAACLESLFNPAIADAALASNSTAAAPSASSQTTILAPETASATTQPPTSAELDALNAQETVNQARAIFGEPSLVFDEEEPIYYAATSRGTNTPAYTEDMLADVDDENRFLPYEGPLGTSHGPGPGPGPGHVPVPGQGTEHAGNEQSHAHLHSHVHGLHGHGHSHAHVHEPTPVPAPEASAPDEAGRPRVLMDLENLLRGLTQGAGVEVVMSMDDFAGGFIPGTPIDEDFSEHGVFLAPILTNPGAAPTTEILQNVIANVLRQNIGDAILLPSQNRPGAQGQTPGQNQEQSRPGQTQNQGQPQSQGQTQNQGPRQSQDSNAERRQQGQAHRSQRRRANDNAFAMACMAYDRYLPCDNYHGRQHLQARRDLYTQQAEAQQRARATLRPSPDIDGLMDRNPRFTPRHMAVMMRLLSGPVCAEGQLNAFMITIARHFFLDQMNENPDEPMTVPPEFAFIRVQLREYAQRLLSEVGPINRINSLENVTEGVITRNMDFLRRIPTITPIRPEVDPTASIRVITRSRLPAIIACVMSEANSEMFAARFYNEFTRFFRDICTLVLCLCEEGYPGLVRIFDAFMAYITENFEASSREWLGLVGRESLHAMRYDMANVLDSARQYFRRADGSVLPPTCCVYRGLRDGVNVNRTGCVMPHICERHLRLTMPITAPQLPEPPRGSGSPIWSRGSTPSTITSDEPQPDTPSPPPVELDDEDTQGSECSHATEHEPECPLHRDAESSSSTMSPCEPRSPTEPQTTRSEGPSPRRSRRYSQSTPEERHLPSEVSSPLPSGIITIGLADSDSTLFEPGNGSDEDIPNDADYGLPASILNRPRDVPNEDGEYDDTIVIDPVTIPVNTRFLRYSGLATAESARRLTDRPTESKIRISAAALRHDPNILTELRMEQLAMEQSAMECEADTQLRTALQRLADKQQEQERCEEQPTEKEGQTNKETENESLSGENKKQEEKESLTREEKESECIVDKETENESQAKDKKKEKEDENFAEKDKEYKKLENKGESVQLESENRVERENKDVVERGVNDSIAERKSESPDKKENEVLVEKERKGESPVEKNCRNPLEQEDEGESRNFVELEKDNTTESESEGSMERDGDIFAASKYQSFMEQENQRLTEKERDLEEDVTIETDLRREESPMISESLREAATRLARFEEQESSALLNEGMNNAANAFNQSIESFYSRPAINYHVLPNEYLESRLLRHPERNIPVLIPTYQPCYAEMHNYPEPEFLTPITYHIPTANEGNNEEYLHSMYSENEQDFLSPDTNPHLLSDDDDELSSIESNNISGSLTPQSRHRANLGLLMQQRVQWVDSSNTNSDTPQGEHEPACREELDCTARVRNSLTPPREPIPSEPKTITPELESPIAEDHSRLATPATTNDPNVGADNLPPSDAAIEQHTNASQTPMESVLDQFERSWEPVFRADEAAQEARPQEPFSDAYLSGMPSRKRRCVRESRPETTLDGLMNEGLRAVSDTGVTAASAPGVSTVELRHFLRESVRTLVRHRAQQEPEDFSPAQYQNTAAFIENAPKSKSQEAEEKNPTATPTKDDTPTPDSVE